MTTPVQRAPHTHGERLSGGTGNTVLTVVGALFLGLGQVGLILFGVLATLAGGICGMSCDAAQIIVNRAYVVIAIGMVLSLAMIIPAVVWRRRAWAFIWSGVLIVVIAAAVAYVVMLTPLSDVLVVMSTAATPGSSVSQRV